MSQPIQELLELYALGLLEDQDLARVERALEQDPTLSGQLHDVDQLMAGLALSLEPVAPSAGLRARLMGSVARSRRFEAFTQQVAALVECTLDRARELLQKLELPGTLEDLGMGISVAHIRPEPAMAAYDVGFVCIQPGMVFPPHTHLGVEKVLVLQGGFEDSLGTQGRAGELHEMADGSQHALMASPGEPLIYLVVVPGVEIPGFELPEREVQI